MFVRSDADPLFRGAQRTWFETGWDDFVDGIPLADGLSWCHAQYHRDRYIRGWRSAFAWRLWMQLQDDAPDWVKELKKEVERVTQ